MSYDELRTSQEIATAICERHTAVSNGNFTELLDYDGLVSEVATAIETERAKAADQADDQCAHALRGVLSIVLDREAVAKGDVAFVLRDLARHIEEMAKGYEPNSHTFGDGFGGGQPK